MFYSFKVKFHLRKKGKKTTTKSLGKRKNVPYFIYFYFRIIEKRDLKFYSIFVTLSFLHLKLKH